MIERTQDYRIVNRIVAFKVRISDECYYLTETILGTVRGIWSFEPYKDGLRIHADMGKTCRGRHAIDSAQDAFGWVFRNTPFKKIYAGIPQKNKPACRVASFAGMRYINIDDYQIRWFELSQGW